MAHTQVTKTHSQNTGVANTFSYSGSFDVFKGTEVQAELDNVQLTFTASTINESASPREYTVDTAAKTIHIGGANLSSGTIIIRPVTDMGSPTPRATYAPGSSITSEDLNNNQTQLMRKAMEYDEQKLSSTGGTMTGHLTLGEDKTIIFEGSTDDSYETSLTVTDPTADRTITLPNVTGTVVTTGDTATVTATMMAANSVDSSELVDGSIDTSHLSNDAVTNAKIADGTIVAGNLGAGCVTTAKVSDSAITTAKLPDSGVTTAKIANDAVTNAKIADGTIVAGNLGAGCITTAAISDSAVTTAKLPDSGVTTAKIADDAITNAKIDGETIVAGNLGSGSVTTIKIASDAVQTAKIQDSAVTTAKIAADAITGAKIADDAIDSEHYTDGSIDTGHIANDAVTNAKIADNTIVSGNLGAGCVVTASVSDSAITTAKLPDSGVTTAKIASNAITTSKITDANVTTDKVADDAITIAKVGCEQTTISDSDSHIPTSGAVVDYVASIINPIGGLEVIADDESFPNTIPAAGVVISITDAAGLSVNSSGVSTNGDALDNSTITINGFPSELRGGVGSNADPYVFASGAGLMVVSTGSSQTYNYHQAMIREADFVQLSDDINDFNSRYRINAGEPGSNNDDGDLVWDTNADKMKVYDGTASAWKEVTSSGDFKYLFLCPAGGSGSPTLDGSIATYDLRESSNSGSAATVTSAAQLIVSINGVVQKANTGTSAPAEGFALVDANTIIFGANLASGDSIFIVQVGSAISIPTPGDGTVVAAKIGSGAVTTAKIADANVTTAKLASDAVTGAKIADDTIDSEHYAAGSIDLEHMSSESVDEDNLHISNAGSNGQYLQKQSGNSGGLTWADVSSVGGATGVDFNDNVKARFGTGNDLEIFHDASDSYIKDTGTGSLKLCSNAFKVMNAANNEAQIYANENGAVELYYDNTKVLETVSGGVEIPDNKLLYIGDSGDLAIKHDGTNSLLTNSTGDLYIQTNGNLKLEAADGGEDYIHCIKDGAVELHYNGSQKLKTTSSGAIVDAGIMELENDDERALVIKRRGSDGTIAQFKRQADVVGTISVDGSSTTYATSSDYRLKENQVSISDGITRVKTLKPYRFNFKANSSKTVDGFFAHEVTPVVPEAVTGTKDAVESEDNDNEGIKKGDIIAQGIDQSKLVPLLTAALQEAIAKIETLETKVTALEAK